ncbi:MAG: LytTR family DNA-binding domain-containing protein [Burkholderiales bacterium]
MTLQTLSSPTGIRSIVSYLGGAGVALLALVLALEPDVGFTAPFVWMALFWALQIGVGLAALQCALFLITRVDRFQQLPLWVVVFASGIAGSIFLSPIYWLIGEGLMEQVLGFPVRVDADGAVEVSVTFGIPAILDEFVDIVGPVTAAWALISWPRLQRLVPPLLNTPLAKSAESDPLITSLPEQAGALLKPAWRVALPSELGGELIAVGSELQYLRVWTTRGSALVLGSLQQVEEAEGPNGIRTHRSWWVNAQHVLRARVQGDGAVCELSNGLQVPVSRRRKADVMERFGNTARYHSKSKALSS